MYRDFLGLHVELMCEKRRTKFLQNTCHLPYAVLHSLTTNVLIVFRGFYVFCVLYIFIMYVSQSVYLLLLPNWRNKDIYEVSYFSKNLT